MRACGWACGRAGVRACGRAGERACGRAGVRALPPHSSSSRGKLMNVCLWKDDIGLLCNLSVARFLLPEKLVFGR